MPDQDPDQPDFDQWWGNFTSRLGDLANLIGPPTKAPPGPGLLGSADEIAAIARAMNGRSDSAASITTSAAQRQLNAPGGLPYYSVPSPHAGHYATLDEAAKAAASDVPRNPYFEYGAFLPQRYVTEDIDLGDGFGPQSISRVDGYDYGGLYTSNDTGAVTLGPAPSHLGAWFHNHPWDFSVNNEGNQRPSPGPDKDEGKIRQLHKNQPLVDTYILGPDGVLRKFWQPGDKGEIVK
jgi:hypothetical protein